MRFRGPVVTYALAAWVALVVLAIANGALREAVFVPAVGTAAGQVASTLLLCVVVLLVAALYLSRLPVIPGRAELVGVGVLWALLTVAFEFAFFVGVMGESVATVAAAFDVSSGQLWVLVPLTTLIAPVAVDFARRRN